MNVRQFVSVAQPDSVLEGGETLRIGRYEFEVIWTPGHSPGTHVLFRPPQARHPDRRPRAANDLPEREFPPEQSLIRWGSIWAPFAKSKIWRSMTCCRRTSMNSRISAGGSKDSSSITRSASRRCCTASEIAPAPHTRWPGSPRGSTGKFENFTPWMQRAAIGETLAHLEYAVSVDHHASRRRRRRGQSLPAPANLTYDGGSAPGPGYGSSSDFDLLDGLEPSDSTLRLGTALAREILDFRPDDLSPVHGAGPLSPDRGLLHDGRTSALVAMVIMSLRRKSALFSGTRSRVSSPSSGTASGCLNTTPCWNTAPAAAVWHGTFSTGLPSASLASFRH